MSKKENKSSKHGRIYLKWPAPYEVAGFAGIPATPEVIYIQDEAPVRSTLGRNDSCWCGSGKKYKKCHLEADQKK